MGWPTAPPAPDLEKCHEHRRSRPAAAGQRGRADRKDVRRLRTLNVVFELRAFIALAVLIIVFSLLSDSFLTVPNLITMTKHVAINAVLALGMLLVILKGGIDLSVGSIVGLSGVVAGELLGGVAIPGTSTIAYPPVWVVVVSASRSASVSAWSTGSCHPVQRGAVHRDARHALRRSRNRPAHLQRHDLPQPRRRPRARQHRLLAPRQRPPAGLPTSIWIMIVLAIGVTAATRQDALRPVAVRHGRQRAGRGALRRPGAPGQDDRLHDLRRLRRDHWPRSSPRS